MSRTGETEPIGVGPKVQQGQDVREGLDNGPHQKLEQQCTFRLITIVRSNRWKLAKSLPPRPFCLDVIHSRRKQ